MKILRSGLEHCQPQGDPNLHQSRVKWTRQNLAAMISWRHTARSHISGKQLKFRVVITLCKLFIHVPLLLLWSHLWVNPPPLWSVCFWTAMYISLDQYRSRVGTFHGIYYVKFASSVCYITISWVYILLSMLTYIFSYLIYSRNKTANQATDRICKLNCSYHINNHICPIHIETVRGHTPKSGPPSSGIKYHPRHIDLPCQCKRD